MESQLGLELSDVQVVRCAVVVQRDILVRGRKCKAA